MTSRSAASAWRKSWSSVMAPTVLPSADTGQTPHAIHVPHPPYTRELRRDWADEAASAVASLRFVAGQYPDDRALAELVGELSMNSREFARLWAKHDVRLCSSGTKRLHHPQVGDLDLHYEVLHLPDSNGQRLLTHTAAGSAAADALALLGCRREAA
ncbi:hypothetical protein RWH44_06780 [Microbacterium sp. KSW2-29]|uniref:MmyB-like transcription regulator ligand binding domain-containing protein n=1 Tax=Microbacterium phycohabitans TaxID=3075993 RepID=A0ABU3SKS0_9MICO|nr:hypothetical protein [Microbacterium sp. KSW2-29]MDU0345407.1 hypothetical protein [Microbacterium sp. KSW2-29]